MFAQLISGRTSDADGVRRALDTWMRDLQPGAIGWLGSTVGVTEDGRFVAIARFESADAAARNSARPEQDRWWQETQPLFDGEVEFAESEDVQIDRIGDLDRAGFVQVMRGRVSDPQRAKELVSRLSTDDLAAFRPEILGTVMVNHDADRWTQAIYFTSEAQAREGERKEWPAEVQAVMEELMSLSPEPPEFIDLRQPMLQSPPAPAGGVPGPRAAATTETAQQAQRA